MLREMPNQVLQFLLDSTVTLLQRELQAIGIKFSNSKYDPM
jgi:hypothetical protein